MCIVTVLCVEGSKISVAWLSVRLNGKVLTQLKMNVYKYVTTGLIANT